MTTMPTVCVALATPAADLSRNRLDGATLAPTLAFLARGSSGSWDWDDVTASALAGEATLDMYPLKKLERCPATVAPLTVAGAKLDVRGRHDGATEGLHPGQAPRVQLEVARLDVQQDAATPESESTSNPGGLQQTGQTLSGTRSAKTMNPEASAKNPDWNAICHQP
jgi:hypothetical protein